ncbi:MAG: hypothetical protein ABUK08_00350 [Candidatus Humimicrobiaceae bacterium]
MPKTFKCSVCGTQFGDKDHMIIIPNKPECPHGEDQMYIQTGSGNYCGICLKRELRKRYNLKRGD